MKGYIKKNLFNILSVAISLVALIILCICGTGIKELFASLASLKLRWLIGAFGCMCIYWLFEALTLHVFSKYLIEKRSFLRTLKVAMTGQLYSALTPFSSGGQPMQIYAMKREGIDAGVAGSIITQKSIVFQIAMTSYSILAICFGFSFFMASIGNFFIIAALGLIINLTVVLCMVIFSRKRLLTSKLLLGGTSLLSKLKIIKNREKAFMRVESELVLFHESIERFKNAPMTQLAAYVLTFIQLTFYYLVPYCVYRCFGLSGATASTILAAQAVITMISAFIPLPGGSGGAEGSFYLFFRLFFQPTNILPALLLWRIISYYSCIVMGAISVAWNPHVRDLA